MSEQQDQESLQGWEPVIGSPADLRDALEKAFHYRGDVTLRLTGGEILACYLFNRQFEAATPFVSVYPSEQDSAARKIMLSDVESIAFTGKDTATGNSWEAWVAKWEAKHGPRG